MSTYQLISKFLTNNALTSSESQQLQEIKQKIQNTAEVYFSFWEMINKTKPILENRLFPKLGDEAIFLSRTIILYHFNGFVCLNDQCQNSNQRNCSCEKKHINNAVISNFPNGVCFIISEYYVDCFDDLPKEKFNEIKQELKPILSKVYFG